MTILKPLNSLAAVFMALLISFGASSPLLAQASKAPNFELTTLDGKPVSLKDYKGQKVLLDFWASWCPPCRKELKVIDGLMQKYPGQYNVLAISVDQTRDAAENYIRSQGYTSFPVTHDEGGNIARQYGVRGIPALYLIDEQGDIVWNHAGALGAKELKKVLDR